MRILLIALVANIVLSAPASAQTVEWQVTTDRQSYPMAQPVTFRTRACNTGAATVTVDINVAPGVVDSNGDDVFGFFLVPWVIMVDIPPGECADANDQVWDQRDYDGDQVAPGWYRGEIFGTHSLPFEIRGAGAVPMSAWAWVLLVLGLGIAGAIALRRT
jgi:hypothetical protein